MSARDAGGPAFPGCVNKILDRYEGMSLRDYFAAKALQGAMAGLLSDGSTIEAGDPGLFAQLSYRIADAMLKAREKQ